MENDITLETQGGEPQLSPSPVEKASSVAPEALTLDELNGFLGKQFKDKQTALQSLKELNSFVGKKKEDIFKEIAGNTETLTNEIRQIKENQFYDRKPEFKDYKDIISKLGDNPESVVESPEFKKIYEKAKGYDETVKLKTVLESNPRLAQSRDALTKARESLTAGNQAEAESHAVNAVLEAYKL